MSHFHEKLLCFFSKLIYSTVGPEEGPRTMSISPP